MNGAGNAIASAQRNRGTIFLEDADVLRREVYPAGQFVLRLQAPKCAVNAVAGSFIHIQCDRSIEMRRPLSIMRANGEAGWIEVMFKVVGGGLRALSDAKTGDRLSVIGPIGRGFTVHRGRPNALLIGGGVGIPPMVFLAEQLQSEPGRRRPIVLMGSEIPFPFELARSSLACDWLPGDVDRAISSLEDMGICSRLASLSGFAGCFAGFVTDLARAYLDSLPPDALAQTEVFACGPTPMLAATAKLAAEFELPCQVSLEEFMACAVGGCAGCAVEIRTDEGPAMKRVCVDGPVFEAKTVF